MGAPAASYVHISVIKAIRGCLLRKAGRSCTKTGPLTWGNDSPAYAARPRGKVRYTAKRHPTSTLLCMYGTAGTMSKSLSSVARLERLCNLPRMRTAPTLMGDVAALVVFWYCVSHDGTCSRRSLWHRSQLSQRSGEPSSFTLAIVPCLQCETGILREIIRVIKTCDSVPVCSLSHDIRVIHVMIYRDRPARLGGRSAVGARAASTAAQNPCMPEELPSAGSEPDPPYTTQPQASAKTRKWPWLPSVSDFNRLWAPGLMLSILTDTL